MHHDDNSLNNLAGNFQADTAYKTKDELGFEEFKDDVKTGKNLYQKTIGDTLVKFRDESKKGPIIECGKTITEKDLMNEIQINKPTLSNYAEGGRKYKAERCI